MKFKELRIVNVKQLLNYSSFSLLNADLIKKKISQASEIFNDFSFLISHFQT